MEIQSAIDLIKYDGLWPTHGSGKSRGYRGDNGRGEETNKRRALSATEDEFSSKLKTWSSNLPERDF